jgi:phage-related protein
VARTQAVYCRDSRGTEPVDEFIRALPPKRAARIDDLVEERLNGQPPEAPPPPFPITSQIEGELCELRVRFANIRCRILYQRSENLVVLLHVLEKDTGAVPRVDIELAKQRTSGAGWMPSGAGRRGPRAKTRLRRAGRYDRLIKMDKPVAVTDADSDASPKGRTAAQAARSRARRSPQYPAAREEYAAIRALREELDRRPHPQAALRAGSDPAGGRPASWHLAFVHLQTGKRRTHPDHPGAHPHPRGAR